MIKRFFIFIILVNIEITISLGAENKFIYDIENPFDKDNNEFNFGYNGASESIYYLIIIKTKSKLNYKYNCGNYIKVELVNNGTFAFALNVKKESCNIVINPYEDSEVKGTIMIHPLNIETNVDLNRQKKYGFEGSTTSEEKCPPITYSISNLDEDTLVKFIYSHYIIRFVDKSISLGNPFKVCLKDDCEENVTTYKFLKGNDYKIYVDFTKVTPTFYEIPSHSFEKLTDDDTFIVKKRLRGTR